MALAPRSPVRMRRTCLILDGDFDLCFWHDLDEVLRASIDLAMAALPPEAADIGNSNALDADDADGLADILELVGLMTAAISFMDPSSSPARCHDLPRERAARSQASTRRARIRELESDK
jgi:hypothetical protein